MAKRSEKKVREESSTEWEEKVLYVNRCSKVVKGGRKFSFSALILVGDNKGKIGYGFAKANEVSDAIRKATELAKRDSFTFIMDKTTIPHDIIEEWDGATILLKPAKEGTGVVAGSKIRSVLELAGIKDIVAKSLGSNNPLNLVRATANALKKLRDKKQCLQERGLVS